MATITKVFYKMLYKCRECGATCYQPVIDWRTAGSTAFANCWCDTKNLIAALNGAHVGNLKRIGAVWKFKAIGYDAAGKVIPGSAPLTERHNTPFSAPDCAKAMP